MRTGQTNARAKGRANPPLLITLDRASDQPLFRQIYQSIRDAILSGRLAGGTRLPATRMLATDLGVARMTVVLAFEQLTTEGFIGGSRSAGTFVTELALPRVVGRRHFPAERRVPQTGKSDEARAEPFATSRPFRVGEPALELFPKTIWNRLVARRARSSGTGLLGYGERNGWQPLRRAIADYTSASRGVRADPDQIILCRGAQQAIDLAIRVLLRPGDKIWFEDPGYPVARRSFEINGMVIAPIPLDNDGLLVDVGSRVAPDAKLAYVAPSHQYPLGYTMSLERRLALLDWAARSHAWILEDDYDSEFRYFGRPLASLQGLDSADRVIYVGTFSKTVFPALRLGYLIVPPGLVDRFMATQASIDRIAPTVEQAALADFIEEGHFTRHLRRMRSAYAERLDVLVRVAKRDMDTLITVEPADVGMHAIAWLRDGVSDAAISRRALARDLEVRPLSAYCQRVQLPPALLLGFANVQSRAIVAAMRVLKSVLSNSV